METEKIADIILNMSLDMDYADCIEMYDEVVADLQSEIEKLDKDSSLLNALETIATENENLYRMTLSNTKFANPMYNKGYDDGFSDAMNEMETE